VAVGESFPVQLLAMQPDAPGSWETVKDVKWSSTDPHVAAVSAGGHLQALHVGSARIEATGPQGSAAIDLTVSRVGVQTIRPTPSTLTVGLGEDVPVKVALRDPFGASLEGRVIRWTSRSPAIARVTPDGRVCGIALGRAELIAASGGASAAVTVRVTPVAVAAVRLTPATAQLAVGEELRFAAEAVSERGKPVSNVTMSWTSSDPAVANVTAGGLLIARRPGTVKIAATAGGRRALSAVTVVR
jgi:uncharacterized protein YjdB